MKYVVGNIPDAKLIRLLMLLEYSISEKTG